MSMICLRRRTLALLVSQIGPQQKHSNSLGVADQEEFLYQAEDLIATMSCH
jgi:hypothetical protein